MRRLLVAIATAMLFAVLIAPSALAVPSPTMTGSDPAAGAEEHEAPNTVTITFDMPLDDNSLIKVVDECGRRIDAENTTVSLNEMSVDLDQKPSGHYKAFYYANSPSGATGSTNGVIEFHVHMGPSCGDGAEEHHHGGGGHEGHEGAGHEGHEGSAHEGHDGTDHTDHSDHATHGDHTSASHTMHTDHAAGSTHTHGTTATGGHHHHGGGQPNDESVQAAPGEPAPRAAGGGPELTDPQAVLVSIGACLLLGLAGGWLIRTTQSPRRTRSA